MKITLPIIVIFCMIIFCSLGQPNDLCYETATYKFIRIRYAGTEMTVCILKQQEIVGCPLYISLKPIKPYSIVARPQVSCSCSSQSQQLVWTNSGASACIPQDDLVENCLRYKEGATTWFCFDCNVGFRINSYNKCTSLIPLCSAYNPSGNCIGCLNGYELRSGACVVKSAAGAAGGNMLRVVQVDDGCLNNVEVGTCPKCKPGYVLVDKVCQSIQEKAETIDKVLGKCFQDEFRTDSGKCAKIFPNCKEYDSDGLCLSCQQPYQFSDDLTQCIRTSSPKAEEICPTAQENDMTYMVVGKKCVKVDVNCVQANEEGCINCKQDYFMWNKRCYYVDIAGEW